MRNTFLKFAISSMVIFAFAFGATITVSVPLNKASADDTSVAAPEITLSGNGATTDTLPPSIRMPQASAPQLILDPNGIRNFALTTRLPQMLRSGHLEYAVVTASNPDLIYQISADDPYEDAVLYPNKGVAFEHSVVGIDDRNVYDIFKDAKGMAYRPSGRIISFAAKAYGALADLYVPNYSVTYTDYDAGKIVTLTGGDGSFVTVPVTKNGDSIKQLKVSMERRFNDLFLFNNVNGISAKDVIARLNEINLLPGSSIQYQIETDSKQIYKGSTSHPDYTVSFDADSYFDPQNKVFGRDSVKIYVSNLAMYSAHFRVKFEDLEGTQQTLTSNELTGMADKSYEFTIPPGVEKITVEMDPVDGKDSTTKSQDFDISFTGHTAYKVLATGDLLFEGVKMLSFAVPTHDVNTWSGTPINCELAEGNITSFSAKIVGQMAKKYVSKYETIDNEATGKFENLGFWLDLK